MSVQGDPLAAEAAPDGPAPLPSWVAALAGPAAWPSALNAARAWEVAGWIAILASAAVLRLAALGDLPLGPDEALPAMEAWRLWLGRPPTDLEGAALLTHALVLAFGLLGASDLTARLPTVAAGLALTAAPLLLRGSLGAVGALGAGSLLGLSPLLVYGSRHVGSGILPAVLLALLVGTIARAAEAAPEDEAGAVAATDPEAPAAADWQRRPWAYGVPVVAALLWAAGSVVLPVALAALAAAAVTWWPPQLPGDSVAAGEALAGRSRNSVLAAVQRAVSHWAQRAAEVLPPPRPALALFAGTLVLIGTAALTHLRGMQAGLVDPWVSWLTPYHPAASAIPWLPTLLVYDLPLALAALVGIVLVIRRSRSFEHFLLWWTTLAAVPLVFQPPDPVPYLLGWAVPLALLGGVGFGALPSLGWTWRDAGKDGVLAVLLAVDACFLVNTLRLVVSSVGGPAGLRARELALSVGALLILAAVHWRVLGWWREALADRPGGARLTRAGALLVMGLGVAFMLTANDRLQFAHGGAGHAELLRPQALTPGVHELAEELKTWARQEPNLPIYVGAGLRPYLLWHLRDVAPAQFHERPPAVGSGATLISARGVWPAGEGAPDGERQPLAETVTIGPIPSTGALWNWWLYRNGWLVPTRHDIIVVR